MGDNKSTIVLKRQTRCMLSKIGRKDQTYDDVITELIESKNKLELLESNRFPNSSNYGHT